MFDIIRFANPKLLWLLLLILPTVGYYLYRLRAGRATMRFSSVAGFKGLPRTAKYYLRHLPFALRVLAVAALVVALARPQSIESNSNSRTEGIDIVLALDVSSSMLARDFVPDRITAAKEVAANFVVDRNNDRIALVVFAGESFTQSPLTMDKPSLLNLLSGVRSGVIEDGTAIGNGLATSINRLRESEAKSKVVILLTDGVNNSGQIAPLTAADIAQNFGVRVYTIGVGTQGNAPYPVRDMYGNISYQPMPVEIDEQTLTQIAQQTGGEYFRATDKDKLKAIYDKINELERTRIEVEEYTLYHEHFAIWAVLALLLLCAEFVLSRFWLHRIP